jgi:hypothetical protein
MTILPTPPANWKRPAMPKGVKATVFARQGGKCADDPSVKIGIGAEPCEFDHRPGLWERKFDTEARDGKGDTIPPANDPDFIQAVAVPAHRRRTKVDAGRKAKEARITGKKAHRFCGPARGTDIGQERDRAPVRKGPRIPSRGFRKDITRRVNGEVRPRG